MGVTSHLSINLGELAGIELQPDRFVHLED